MKKCTFRKVLVLLIFLSVIVVAVEDGGGSIFNRGVVLFKNHQYDNSLWYFWLSSLFPKYRNGASFYYGYALIRMRSFEKAEKYISNLPSSSGQIRDVLITHLAEEKSCFKKVKGFEMH
ncbi:MAG: hypothetical protein WA705_04050 [Candidatus Ozemobacteraceae bacterium]